MASRVEICNMALTRITGDRITNATVGTDSEEEIECSLAFPIIRDALLEAHPWNFAEKRAVLASLVETPAFEFNFFYQLPADFITALQMYDTSETYVIEGDRLLTNATTVQLRYTAQIQTEGNFSPMFVNVLYLRLAAHLATVFPKSAAMASVIEAEEEKVFARAKQRDAQQGTNRRMRIKNGFVDIRKGLRRPL